MITCQKCRALLEPGTSACPYCGSDQRHHAAPSETEDADRTTRFGLWILGVILGIFALMLVLDPARGDPGAGQFKPSGLARVMFGAPNTALVRECGQTWRLLASMFLHIDLLHLSLNSISLLVLIPVAAGAFGVHRTVCLYFASGICGALLSHATGPGGVGASGALCGLIGACAVYGRRRGGAFGEALTRRMIGWAVLIGIVGLAWGGAGGSSPVDNAGHLGGFLGGAALGWIAAGVRARGGRADRAWVLAARVTVAGALLVAVIFWAPFVLRIFERREMDLYWRHADRTLRAVAAAIDDGKAEGLPKVFREGPRGSEAVRDAVREALARARSKDPAAATSLQHANKVLADWTRTLFCAYAITP